jgi:hypothetical protein
MHYLLIILALMEAASFFAHPSEVEGSQKRYSGQQETASKKVTPTRI